MQHLLVGRYMHHWFNTWIHEYRSIASGYRWRYPIVTRFCFATLHSGVIFMCGEITVVWYDFYICEYMLCGIDSTWQWITVVMFMRVWITVVCCSFHLCMCVAILWMYEYTHQTIYAWIWGKGFLMFCPKIWGGSHNAFHFMLQLPSLDVTEMSQSMEIQFAIQCVFFGASCRRTTWMWMFLLYSIHAESIVHHTYIWSANYLCNIWRWS